MLSSKCCSSSSSFSHVVGGAVDGNGRRARLHAIRRLGLGIRVRYVIPSAAAASSSSKSVAMTHRHLHHCREENFFRFLFQRCEIEKRLTGIGTDSVAVAFSAAAATTPAPSGAASDHCASEIGRHKSGERKGGQNETRFAGPLAFVSGRRMSRKSGRNLVSFLSFCCNVPINDGVDAAVDKGQKVKGDAQLVDGVVEIGQTPKNFIQFFSLSF